jgi:hypothetical protein
MSRRNNFESWCYECREYIPVGCGFLLPKDPRCGWRVICDGCFARATAAAAAEVEAAFAAVAAWSRPVHIPPCLLVLGLTPPVDREAVKRKFRALAKASHPDMGGDAARFVAIQGAYREALSFVGGARS